MVVSSMIFLFMLPCIHNQEMIHWQVVASTVGMFKVGNLDSWTILGDRNCCIPMQTGTGDESLSQKS